ncbi:MAG: ornithine cyclodeaminase family protein [Desulfovermiculus sp.]|nr:ornithine cyclodeaminase family protein [Desulfovermiculus sp.]
MAEKILYLSREDVEAVGVQMSEIIETLDVTFKEKGEGRYEMPPKPGIHPGQDSFMHAMPAYVPHLKAAGIKWVSGNPGNQARGLPYISGLLILNDPDTGIPLCVMDATWITGKRTGAASAVAAKYMAKEDSSSLGVIACGVQGRSHLEAFSCLFPLRTVKAYDIHADVAAEYAKDMSAAFDLEVQVVSTVKEAVQAMDIVVTSGPILKDPTPSIEPGWLSPGGFASPVDFDSYWTGEALQEMDKLATDDIQQMEYYRKIGYFQKTPQAYADLGDIAAGKKPGRENDKERTAALNLGVALDDMTTASLIYDRALAQGIGRVLPL